MTAAEALAAVLEARRREAEADRFDALMDELFPGRPTVRLPDTPPRSRHRGDRGGVRPRLHPAQRDMAVNLLRYSDLAFREIGARVGCTGAWVRQLQIRGQIPRPATVEGRRGYDAYPGDLCRRYGAAGGGDRLRGGRDDD